MAKAASGVAGQVFRLSDMDVEEVSMVDRAANKKTFLVVKRDGDQMATEVQPNGKGGFSTSKSGKTGKVAKAGAMEVPPGFKEAVAPLLDKASEALAGLSESVGGSSTADLTDDGEMPGVPADFANGITSVMNLLDRAQSMWPTAAPEPEEGAEGGEGLEGAEADAATAMTMRLALENVEKAFRAKRLQKALIQKVGAKMSKDRLTRLQQAVAALSNLVNEVAGAQPAPPTGAPPLGKTAKNADPLAALSTQVGQLAEQVGKITAIVVKDHTKLEAISKARGVPAGSVVEATEERSTTAEEVSWPLDMNDPITRETVGKNESFFDDE